MTAGEIKQDLISYFITRPADEARYGDISNDIIFVTLRAQVQPTS